jgi:serine acetyltransferase
MTGPAEERATGGPPEPNRPARNDPGMVRGMSFEEAKAMQDLPPREHSIGELIWSDYLAQYGMRPESERKRKLMFVPRLIVNVSMHACVLVRLLQGTPLWMTWFWRRLLIALHACDFQPHCRIGPGLRMPHPLGILVGHGVLGSNVVLQHHITLSAVTTNWDTGEPPGWFHVGDGVTVFTGSVIVGPVVIGDGAVIGANSLIVRDIPAGHIVIAGRTRPATEAERTGGRPVASD